MGQQSRALVTCVRGEPPELQHVNNPISSSFSILVIPVGKPQRGFCPSLPATSTLRLPADPLIVVVSFLQPMPWPLNVPQGCFPLHLNIEGGGHLGYHLQAEAAELAQGWAPPVSPVSFIISTQSCLELCVTAWLLSLGRHAFLVLIPYKLTTKLRINYISEAP